MSDIVHDWTPYNRWADMVADGVGRSNQPEVSPTDWWAIAKAAALCVLAVALMLWAWRDPKIAVPEVKVQVEQPPITAPLPPAMPQSTGVPPDTKVVRNYVLFTERVMPSVGVVVTGWKFDSQNNPRPVEQWCYLAPLYGGEPGTIPRIELPRLNGATASAAALRRHQLTPDEVEKARQNCAWFQD